MSPGRESRGVPDIPLGPNAATYHHTVTISDHIGWALVPTSIDERP